MSPQRPFPLLLFGSQTGTAADVADKVWRRALTRGASALRDVRVRSMDAYLEEVGGELPPFPSSEWAVVLVCATAGQGDPPDNAARFWRRLMRKAVPGGACRGLKIAVLGLGDSSYPKYNFVAKKLFRRLIQLGAEPLLPLSLADDQHPLGIDAAVSPWLDQLLEALIAASGLPSTGPDPVPCELPLRFQVDRCLSDEEVFSGRLCPTGSATDPVEDFFPRGSLVARIKSNERVTAEDHFQDTRLVVFDRPEGFPEYRPGQVLMVQPRNASDQIAVFFSLLHPSLSPGLRLTIGAAHPCCHPVATHDWPQPCSLLWLATHIFDLNAVPRKAFFEVFASFAEHEAERERLQELCDPENLDELLQYCMRARRTCLEVLADFPHSTALLSARQLLELLPQIRPRAFSIASSPRAHPSELHLLVAVVNYKSRSIVKRRRGLCSNFLANARHDDLVPVWLSPGHGLRFPPAASPLILIGPGTGVAPFRSVLQERAAEERTEGQEKDLLVFGCRYEKKDFYFREEWRELEARGAIDLAVAFSRDREHTDGSRLYVQHVLAARSPQLWRLLSAGAAIFVAGSSRSMPQAVREAVTAAIRTEGQMTQEAAEAAVQSLERTGRYQTETWA